jgi:hypothetical protein
MQILAGEFGGPVLPAIPELSGRRDIPQTGPSVLIDTVERTRTEELYECMRPWPESCCCLSPTANPTAQICHSDVTVTTGPCPRLTTNRCSTA